RRPWHRRGAVDGARRQDGRGAAERHRPEQERGGAPFGRTRRTPPRTAADRGRVVRQVPAQGLMRAGAWAPQPGPQTAFIECPAFEVVYGGARGGGKTDASLGEFANHAERCGEAARGLFVRRTRT